MKQLLRMIGVAGLAIACLTSAAPAWAQAPAPAGQTASQFYMAYRKAFDAAKKIEDVLSYMSTPVRQQIEGTPAADRPKMFEMIKMMGALTDVKIVKETPTPNGATLTVEALDPGKAKTTGTIEIVKEKGAWKLGKEDWKS